jgi:alkylhydroperoxidase family enzyme
MLSLLSRVPIKLPPSIPRTLTITTTIKTPFSTYPACTMRLPYAPAMPNPDSAEDQRIYAAVAERRAPRPLQPLDLTLLHAPPLAAGYNAFLSAVRTQTTLPAAVRELAIARIAVLNNAPYEWAHHAPLALAAGVSQTGLDLISRKETRVGSEGLGEREWAVVRYTDAMTRDVEVAAEVFQDLRRWFDEREVVELTVTVAAYNAVSRILVALDGEYYSFLLKRWRGEANGCGVVGEKNGTEISADPEKLKH